MAAVHKKTNNELIRVVSGDLGIDKHVEQLKPTEVLFDISPAPMSEQLMKLALFGMVEDLGYDSNEYNFELVVPTDECGLTDYDYEVDSSC